MKRKIQKHAWLDRWREERMRTEQAERKILMRLINTKAVGEEDPDAIWGRKYELEDTLGRRLLLDPLRAKLPRWRW